MKKLIYLLIIFSLTSCETEYFATVLNHSGKNVILKIYYNSDTISKFPNGKSNLKTELAQSDLTIKFDSINYIAEIELKPNEQFDVDFGFRHKPNFHSIQKMKIIKSDTTTLEYDILRKTFYSNDLNLVIN
ncbi:hypothetical protein [Flavobacterium pallidum]|uniref:Lipoprotein n=1 Tax=Flavobacterium pallidum TaxID=2172098 RepID=A0A2S1SKE8_9FLAO|nr:hypothetical protein [Flavobacterium pallidum]AWI26851.1 hypothetical protein HYN49_13600 [Flavobacterium pallidum]